MAQILGFDFWRKVKVWSRMFDGLWIVRALTVRVRAHIFPFRLFGSLLGLVRLDLDLFFSFVDFFVTMSCRLAYFEVVARSFDLESSSELEFHLNSIELELSSELDILGTGLFESLSRLEPFGVGLEYILSGFRNLV